LLLPERHPVKDFFVLDVLDVVPKSDMASMEHPIFSLSTKPDTRVLTYGMGDTRLRITPCVDGLPTIFDKDVLIYCISHLMHRKNQGREISRHVRLTTHDLLVNTNRPTNNLGYERLAPALRRLAGALFETNIRTGDEMTTRGFHLIDGYEYNRKGSMFADRLQYLEISLSDWLFRAIEAAEVLPISREYFRLRAPLDRRIYEIARKHCGTEQRLWRIGLEKLQAKTGSKQLPRHFGQHVRRVVAEDHLPDYGLKIEDDSDNVIFYPKKMLKAPQVDGVTAATLDWLIPSGVLEEARFDARARNRDFDALKEEFVGFMAAKGKPDNMAAAFLGFVRKKQRL
jgi:plasmid replication initiation protein